MAHSSIEKKRNRKKHLGQHSRHNNNLSIVEDIKKSRILIEKERSSNLIDMAKAEELGKLFSIHINNSESLELIEKYFYDLLSKFGDYAFKELEKNYLEGKKAFSRPCVLIVPSSVVGVDIAYTDFDLLATMNNDKEAVKTYNKFTPMENFIPCYLFSIDITRTNEKLPENYQYQLHMIGVKPR